MIHHRHFQKDADDQFLACQTLWRFVLAEAVRNSEGRIAGNNMSDYSAEALVRRSRAWFEGNSKDFQLTCEFAGFEPSRVRRAWKNGTLDADALIWNHRVAK